METKRIAFVFYLHWDCSVIALLLGCNINAFEVETKASSQLIANQWGRELVELNIYPRRNNGA